jgi:quercetin dioxygenase-like cupin family protein
VGVLATIKATKEQTGGQYTLVEILAPEGYPGVLHVHHSANEGFWVLEGELTFYVGDQTMKARPGSFLFGPKDVPHAFTVDSGPARLLFVLSPAGFEDLIREMGEPAREPTIPPQPEEPSGEAEMQQMAAIAAKYGNEILGPPPGH